MIKDKSELKIVYMGTPDFAVASLAALVEGGYNVVGVVTMPDKPIGRHQSHVSASPVKQYAVAHNIQVLQPERLKDKSFLEALKALKADLQVVVAFRMLPEVVWAMPKMGTFNLHAALLPQYRGAAPINWAVINGDKTTGVTTFFLDHNIDTGRIIFRTPVSIEDTDTAGTVHDKLMVVGASLVVKTVDAICSGKAQTTAQEDFVETEPLRHAPKIYKDTCRIDWSKPTKAVYDFIRGLSPYPAAWTELYVDNDSPKVLKIYETRKTSKILDIPESSIIIDGEHLFVALSDGVLEILSLQIAGKKRMTTPDFLRGFHPKDSQIKVQ